MKAVAKDVIGKAAYPRVRGLKPARSAELVREFLAAGGQGELFE